jgi:hypothetical protein
MPVSTTPDDVSPSGVLDLGGSQSELMSDTLAAYSDTCWTTQSLHNPTCNDPSNPVHALRGGGWALPRGNLLTTLRSDSSVSEIRASYGFRCAFSSPPPSTP